VLEYFEQNAEKKLGRFSQNFNFWESKLQKCNFARLKRLKPGFSRFSLRNYKSQRLKPTAQANGSSQRLKPTAQANGSRMRRFHNVNFEAARIVLF
jgi:hypothetical protein